MLVSAFNFVLSKILLIVPARLSFAWRRKSLRLKLRARWGRR